MGMLMAGGIIGLVGGILLGYWHGSEDAETALQADLNSGEVTIRGTRYVVGGRIETACGRGEVNINGNRYLVQAVDLSEGPNAVSDV